MIKPLKDYVLLKKDLVEKKVGSIILTTEQDKNDVATVVAVGPGKIDSEGKLIPMDVKVGEKVLFKQYSTSEYKEKDDKYLLVKQEDIIAIVE